MVSLTDNAKSLLDGILAAAVTENKLPAVSFAVTSAEKELYIGHAGRKAIHRPSGSVDDDSTYWLCSMGKIIPTIALLQLIERGLFSYDTPVEEVLPEMRSPVVVTPDSDGAAYKPAENKILMRHILNHTSGLSYAIPYYEGANKVQSIPGPYQGAPFEGDHSVAKFFSLIKATYPSIPLAFEPGTSWTYGYSADICGFVVERATRMNLQDYCDKHIFGPLGISLSFWLTQHIRDNLVHLTVRSEDGTMTRFGNQYALMEQDISKSKLCIGGGVIYSNVRDYLAIFRHLLLAKDGRAPNPILKPESIESMFSYSIPETATTPLEGFLDSPRDMPLQFGHGFCVTQNDWPGRRKKGSGFWYGWAGLYNFVDPDTGIAAVYATQVLPTRDAEVVALFQRLEEAVYKSIR